VRVVAAGVTECGVVAAGVTQDGVLGSET
jgi:hypothetical protein